MPHPKESRSVHHAARLEDVFYSLLDRGLRRRGWRPRVVAYTGYGTDGWVRVLGRVLLVPPGTRRRDLDAGRGWRRFFSVKVAGVPVTVEIAGRRYELTSERGGYLDEVVSADLSPGWTRAVLSAQGCAPSEAAVRVVGSSAGFGVVSDIDDTVVITALPRPLLAFWNTFVRHETDRRPVPGMADLYHELIATRDDAFVVYLSTGPWNFAPALERFLARHGFPRGPLLMTDWGPTPEGWFRSGRTHKRTQLRRLLAELPQLRWILIGDDGQHDRELYAEAAATAPDRVRLVLIRQLSATEQLRTHGTPQPLSDPAPPTPVVELRAPDGVGLRAAVESAHVG